jgi:hypothetical protein
MALSRFNQSAGDRCSSSSDSSSSEDGEEQEKRREQITLLLNSVSILDKKTISFGGRRLTQLAAPIEGSDAVTLDFLTNHLLATAARECVTKQEMGGEEKREGEHAEEANPELEAETLRASSFLQMAANGEPDTVDLVDMASAAVIQPDAVYPSMQEVKSERADHLGGEEGGTMVDVETQTVPDPSPLSLPEMLIYLSRDDVVPGAVLLPEITIPTPLAAAAAAAAAAANATAANATAATAATAAAGDEAVTGARSKEGKSKARSKRTPRVKVSESAPTTSPITPSPDDAMSLKRLYTEISNAVDALEILQAGRCIQLDESEQQFTAFGKRICCIGEPLEETDAASVAWVRQFVAEIYRSE